MLLGYPNYVWKLFQYIFNTIGSSPVSTLVIFPTLLTFWHLLGVYITPRLAHYNFLCRRQRRLFFSVLNPCKTYASKHRKTSRKRPLGISFRITAMLVVFSAFPLLVFAMEETFGRPKWRSRPILQSSVHGGN